MKAKSKRSAYIRWGMLDRGTGRPAGRVHYFRRDATKAIEGFMLSGAGPKYYRAAKVAVIELTPDNAAALRRAGFKIGGKR